MTCLHNVPQTVYLQDNKCPKAWVTVKPHLFNREILCIEATVTANSAFNSCLSADKWLQLNSKYVLSLPMFPEIFLSFYPTSVWGAKRTNKHINGGSRHLKYRPPSQIESHWFLKMVGTAMLQDFALFCFSAALCLEGPSTRNLLSPSFSRWRTLAPPVWCTGSPGLALRCPSHTAMLLRHPSLYCLFLGQLPGRQHQRKSSCNTNCTAHQGLGAQDWAGVEERGEERGDGGEGNGGGAEGGREKCLRALLCLKGHCSAPWHQATDIPV